MLKPAFFLILVISPFSAWAEPFSFNAVNPSFGGNPNNGSHLLSVASKQYTPPLIERKKQSDLEYFASQIQRRTLSTIASEFTSNLRNLELDDDEQAFVIGDFTINYSLNSEGDVSLVMIQDGETIEIIVPSF